MHRSTRPTRAHAGVLLLVALALSALATAAPALAGGWASATLDGSPPSPNAGQPAEILFTLKQHGLTPIDWEQATVIATKAGSDETVSVIAEARGNGHYAAIVTFPSEGTWSWRIELRDLMLEAPPFPAITVHPAASPLPATRSGMPSEIVAGAAALAVIAGLGILAFLMRRRARAGRLVPA
jgi:hypothetical protein